MDRDFEFRRRLVRGMLAVLGVAASGKAAARPHLVPPSLAHRLAALFEHRDSAAIVGREYLQHRPEERDPELLLRLITKGDRERFEAAASDLVQLKSILREQRRDDFDRDEIMMLNGCLLSLTELRLCALCEVV